MQVSPDETMARRVDRLEAQNRGQRRVGTVLVLVTVVFLVGGAVLKDPSIVKAEKILLVDKDGNTRATLGTSGKGEPYLAFMDQNQKVGLSLEHRQDGAASLTMFDRNEKDRLHLAVEPEGVSYLTLSDHKDKQYLNLQSGKDGVIGLHLYDEDARSRGSFLLDQHGSPALIFSDKESTPRIGLSLFPNGKPVLELYDKKETRVVFGFPENSDTATLLIKGQAGEGSVRAQAKEDGSSQLQVFDKDGKAQFQAPNP